MLGSAPNLRRLHRSAGRGRPYRGDTGCRGPFRQSPPPTAPSAAGRWGCVRGRAGWCHGSLLGGGHLRGRKRSWSKVWGGLQDSFPPPPLACSQPRGALEEAEGAQRPEQLRRHDSRHFRGPRENGWGKAEAPNFPGDRAPERAKGLDP